MKTSRKSVLALVGAMAMGAAMAAPSVEIVSVQQQYPWTNTVDIVYNVAGVESETNGYFVVFTPTTSTGVAIPDVNGETSVQVALKGSGVYSTQWYPQTNQQYTACKMTPSVFRGAAKDYMIVDLETGAVTYEPMATQADSNKRYNTDEYKTTKMVLRRIPKGDYPVRRVKADLTEVSAMAHMEKDYYITIFQVTAAQYNRIKDTPPYTDMMPKRSISYTTLRGGALAKANVVPSAQGDVIARLNYKTGMTFDLPNLAMTQVAAHANQNKDWQWFWGETADDMAKYARCTGSYNTCFVVGSLGNDSANPWGIFDAYGNVWEHLRDTVTYQRFNAVGNQNDDASLTQEPTQTGNYVFRYAGAPGYRSECFRTACTARDPTASGSSFSMGGCRFALIAD